MEFKSILTKAFPFISAAASVGGLPATMVANLVGAAFGIDKVDPTPQGIETAVTVAQAANPDAFARLQGIENDFKLRMAELGFDSAEKLAELGNADRSSARAREIAIKDKLPAILALVVTGGFFLLLWVLAFKEVPSGSQTILNIMVGTLGTAWISVVNYYYGSSSGSAAKTAIIASQTAEK